MHGTWNSKKLSDLIMSQVRTAGNKTNTKSKNPMEEGTIMVELKQKM